MTRDRIVLLDAIRGMAILGILLCNVPIFSHVDLVGLDFPERWPHAANAASTFVWWLTEVFFDKRFVTLFSMMFGISIYLVGGERRDPARSAVLHRRLFWLAIFGLVHGTLIWRGDVLLDYAVTGSLVMLCRSWSPKRLLIVGLGIWLAFELLAIWGNLYFSIANRFNPDFPGMTQAIAAETRAYQATLHSSLVANFASWKTYFARKVIFDLSIVAPMMLIGLGLFKLGLFTGRLSRGTYLAFLGGGALGLVCVAAAATADVAAVYSQPTALLMDYFRELLAPIVALGYVAGLAVLMASPRWSAIPRLLAPVGRMAFTNYLMQSIIMTAVFYGGRGPDLFGRLDRPALALIVLVVWIAEITWSHLWLRRFTTGPFEWVWRWLYRRPGERQPGTVVPA
jgi:uncharacterized protein